MGATREDLVKLAREAVSGIHRPSYCDNPASFDPHEWVLEAMARAYKLGRENALDLIEAAVAAPKCARCGRTACIGRALGCIDDGAALYPEGG